jgi:transposase-like protein
MSHRDKEELVKAQYITGESSAAIAAKFGMNARTVQRWANEGNWDKLRQNNDKVVQINAAATVGKAQAVARAPRKTQRDFDALELVDDAIAILSGSMHGDVDPRAIGGIANSLRGLIEFRRKLCPPTAADLVEQAIALGISPAEFARELREAWGKRA